MKKIVILVLVISMLTTVAYAQGESSIKGIGGRAGFSISPEQFFIGGFMDMGQLVGPMRVVPNLEIGFGDNHTSFCINGDLIYDIEDTPFSAGAELGINHVSYSSAWGSASATDIGLSILGNYKLELGNGTPLILEAKLGLTNSADFKVSAGYNFF